MGAWIYRIQILDIIKLHFPLRLKEKASYGNIVLVYFILLLFNLAFFYCTTHALESARQSIISVFFFFFETSQRPQQGTFNQQYYIRVTMEKHLNKQVQTKTKTQRTQLGAGLHHTIYYKI